MAAKRVQSYSNRKTSLYGSNQEDRSTYVYGSTVRQMQVQPERREEQEPERPAKREVSPQVRRNRNRALRMNPAYVAFLVFAAALALTACVWYLHVRSELSSRSAHVAQLQQELASAKEENDAKYSNITNSVNLEEVREKAIGEMGMHYADADQIITYSNPENDYVKQYSDIPSSGVLASDN